jgi:hypothetical protein
MIGSSIGTRISFAGTLRRDEARLLAVIDGCSRIRASVGVFVRMNERTAGGLVLPPLVDTPETHDCGVETKLISDSPPSVWLWWKYNCWAHLFFSVVVRTFLGFGYVIRYHVLSSITFLIDRQLSYHALTGW